MTTSSVSATTGTSGSLLNWQFQRGVEALTCEVRTRGNRRFDVQVTLAWSGAPALVERFDSPIAAVERHAALASMLMDAGWVVTQHTTADAPLAA
jgi:hypothetical protein